MTNRTPVASPWYPRNRRANSSARSRSGPSTRISVAGAASSRTEGVGTAAPSPPNRRPRLPRRSSTPKCRRAPASTKTLPRLDIIGKESHRLLLAGAGRFVHDHLQTGVLLTDLLGGDQVVVDKTAG